MTEKSKAVHVLHRIQSTYKQLSDKEKKVADYILAQPERIVYATINQIADDLSIADATVFRFCKRLGFKGYQALKIALASEIVHPIQDIHETIEENDSEVEIMTKVFQSNKNALTFTQETLDETSVRQAVQFLLEAKQVHFYGSGGSGVTALDGQHKFMRTGLPAQAYTDSHFQLMAASQLQQGDVAILISHTGSNVDLLEVIDVVKKHNAIAIAITSYAKNPLSKKADLVLHTVSQETAYRSEALSSRIAELSLLDGLYVNYCMKRKEQTQEALRRVREAISRKRV